MHLILSNKMSWLDAWELKTSKSCGWGAPVQGILDWILFFAKRETAVGLWIIICLVELLCTAPALHFPV